MGVFKPGDGVLGTFRKKLRASNGMAIALVYTLLFVDTLLLTSIVPILPEYFRKDFTGGGHPTETTPATTNTTSGCSPLSKSQYNFFSTENLYIGILFASKPFIQGLGNLAVGPIVDRIGFSLPIMFGTVIMCSSALLYSFGTSYAVLFAARAIQGLGSSSASVAGIAMLADRYRDEDDEKRGQAIGIAFGGLAMGVLIGPSFAGAVYEAAGKAAVFIILAAFAFAIGSVFLFVNGITIEKRGHMMEPISIFTLLCDPYIILAAMTLLLGNVGAGVLETTMPMWMIETMCAAKWQLGVAFLPLSIAYLISVNIVAIFCQRLPRWFFCSLGLVLIGAGCVGIPFATSIVLIIPAGVVYGTGVGFIDASIFPMMAVLVDTRHRAVYGSVYAIADIAYCACFTLGPLYAGLTVGLMGFQWVLWVLAIVAFLFAPLVYLLKKPTTITEESSPLLEDSQDKNYDDSESKDQSEAGKEAQSSQANVNDKQENAN